MQLPHGAEGSRANGIQIWFMDAEADVSGEIPGERTNSPGFTASGLTSGELLSGNHADSPTKSPNEFKTTITSGAMAIASGKWPIIAW